MAEILDIIDPKDSDMQGVLESVRSNFATINKTSLRAGANILVDTVGKTTQTVSSASYVPLTDFQGSFNASGGLVLFEFSTLKDSTAGTTSIALFVDDEEKAWAYSYETAGSLLENMIISRWIELNAGNHKYQFKCKVTAANASVGPASTGANGTLSIIEFLRG
jgi:hypothetical protein